MFGGVQFFDKNDKKIIEAGFPSGTDKKEFILEEGHRLIGVKANRKNLYC